jgi:hypothetical protein
VLCTDPFAIVILSSFEIHYKMYVPCIYELYELEEYFMD